MPHSAVVVDLVYVPDCPSLPAARERLAEALRASGLPPHWREWNLDARDTPEAWQRLGSPSILVNGADVDPAGAAAQGRACRVTGAPSLARIESGLRAALSAREGG